jgi:hypothetical protein
VSLGLTTFQITINSIPVGRSVLEALRLVEAFKAVAEKGVLCPANWRIGEDNIVDTSFTNEDHHLALELGDLKVRNVDDNMVAPFALALPASRKRSTQQSAPTSASNSKRSSTVCTASRHDRMHSRDSNIVTPAFVDMLEHANGASSPHKYVKLKEAKTPEGK